MTDGKARATRTKPGTQLFQWRPPSRTVYSYTRVTFSTRVEIGLGASTCIVGLDIDTRSYFESAPTSVQVLALPVGSHLSMIPPEVNNSTYTHIILYVWSILISSLYSVRGALA